jgi:hypothetical protein
MGRLRESDGSLPPPDHDAGIADAGVADAGRPEPEEMSDAVLDQ